MRIVKGAPIYKSHAEYGFIEPIKYYKKNPAVSEIRIIKDKLGFNEFILSTLGTDTIQRPLSNHLIHYKYNFDEKKLNLIEKFNVRESVRDIHFDSSTNRVYYVGESSGVIGYIDLN